MDSQAPVLLSLLPEHCLGLRTSIGLNDDNICLHAETRHTVSNIVGKYCIRINDQITYVNFQQARVIGRVNNSVIEVMGGDFSLD